MKSLPLCMVSFCWLVPALAFSAEAEILYDKEGVQLQGMVRIVSPNAATCNVLEEKYSAEEYGRLKANQDRPLHVWQLDFSAHNNTGRTLDFLQANFVIQAPQAPCTNWSGEGPGGGPAGAFTDLQGNRGFVEPAGVKFKGLSRVSAMGAASRARQVVIQVGKNIKQQVVGSADLWKTSNPPCGGAPHTPLPQNADRTLLDQTTTTNTTGSEDFAL